MDKGLDWGSLYREVAFELDEVLKILWQSETYRYLLCSY